MNGFEELYRRMQKDVMEWLKIAERQLLNQLFGLFGQVMGPSSPSEAFDPYKILGLDRSASDEEIERRYKELVRRLHPDTAGVKGTEFLFQLVKTAYDLIKSERKGRR